MSNPFKEFDNAVFQRQTRHFVLMIIGWSIVVIETLIIALHFSGH